MFDVTVIDIIGNSIIGALAHKTLKKFIGEKKATIAVMVGAAASYFVPKAIKYVKEHPKKERTMTVTSMNWRRHVTIEKFSIETKSGWELENGAYDVKVERKPREVHNPTEIVSPVGSISIPVIKDDVYYIYKLNVWERDSFRVVEGEGLYDHSIFKAAWDSIKVTFDSATETTPKEGDTRKLAHDTEYYISGIDDETGQLYSGWISKSVYDTIRVGERVIVDKLGYDRKTIKSIRKLMVIPNDTSKDAPDIIEITASETRESDDSEES